MALFKIAKSWIFTFYSAKRASKYYVLHRVEGRVAVCEISSKTQNLGVIFSKLSRHPEILHGALKFSRRVLKF